MTTAYTSLLGLALPVTGELSGTWGDTVNNSITSLLDSAIAGTTTLSADTTLTTTTGASNQARQAILLCTGHVANITITAPAQSKIYTVINASATYTVKIRGVGPTTGITIPVSSTATVAWNGSDFVDASGYINGNLRVNGTLTVTGAGSIQTLTVGLGAGAVATNTAVGVSALAANTSGSNNTAVGYQAAYTGTTATQVVAIGSGALYANTVNYGTAVGFQALTANTTGAANAAFGATALAANTTGAGNSAFGSFGFGLSDSPLQANTTGSYNSAFGLGALAKNTTASSNTAVGYQAGYSTTTVAGITAIGTEALYSNTTGYNAAVGYRALYANTTGTDNVAIGGSTGAASAALRFNTTGNYNVAIGVGSLTSNTTASSNTAVGYQAGYSNQTGATNTFVGQTAGYSTTSGGNTFVGATSGSVGAGYFVTTGAKNTIIGGYHGNQGGLDIRTRSNFIVLSDGDGNPRFYSDDGGNLYAGASNVSFLINSTGGDSRFGSINATNVLQISYNSTTSGVSLTSAATSWGTFSDQRLKNVTGVYENALSDIAQIEPIKFTWKSDESNKPCVGVLAHTVRAVVPEAVEEVANSKEDETLYLQVRYTELIPLMIASIKELKAEVDSLKSQLNGA
jgi:hypothetical protein